MDEQKAWERCKTALYADVAPEVADDVARVGDAAIAAARKEGRVEFENLKAYLTKIAQQLVVVPDAKTD